MPASRFASLSAAVEAAPQRALVAILALHALVWTVLPDLLYPNLPLDLIEALTYGREWQLGYDKLPPLPWWLVEIAWRLAGHDFAYYLLAQIAVVVALAFVYAAARPLAGPVGALAAVLIVDGLHYLNYTAAKFNHDVIQLPFWAMAGYALHRGLRRGRLADWLLLGLAIGILVWAKYFVVVLVAPMVALALIDQDARKALMTPGPYVAAVVALIIAAPHLIWLVANDFLPFAYAEHRAVLPRGWYDHLWHPFKFAIGQFGFMIPALIIALPLFWPRKTADEAPPAGAAGDFDRRIVTWLAFGPCAVVLLLGVVSGRGAIAMWGYPLWLFLGLWLVLTARRPLDGARLTRIVVTWAIVLAALAAAFIVNYEILPRFDHRYRAVFFPGEALAREITTRTRAITGQAPVYVIGSMWDGGNIGHYAKSRPRVLIDGKPERAPWIDLNDLRARGAIIVWTDADTTVVPPMYRTVAPDAAVQPSFTLPYRRGPGSVEIGWAILLPKPSFAAR
ncbi:glycosyltransferase family 39 protein [Undibacter mobilis]|uniref:Glycosyltransferase n=1 Tax=Undibacter mobilis TaxID=2292256 RepID=A0A371BBG3_9BRAD|nr:glycosyltransferase family 39 protein [Undibacter mobilis]RDV04914.1 glycosyltransferase [Undibacter mobilis]